MEADEPRDPIDGEDQGIAKKPVGQAVDYTHISLRQAKQLLDAETYAKFAEVAFRFFAANGHLAHFDEVMITVPVTMRAREPREDTEIELWPEDDENEDDFMDRCVGELTVCIGDRAESVCAEKWEASKELGKKGLVTLSMLSGDLALAPCGTSCLGCRGFDPDEPRDEQGRWTEGGGGSGGAEPEAPAGGEKPLLISEQPDQEKLDTWNKQLTDRQEELNQAGKTGEHEDDQLNGMQMALSAYSQEDEKHLEEERSGINVRYDLDNKLLAAAYTDIIHKPQGAVAKIAYFGSLDADAFMHVVNDLTERFGKKVDLIEVQRWKDDPSLPLWEQAGFKQKEEQAGLTNLSAVMLEKRLRNTATAPDFEHLPVPVTVSEGTGTDFQTEVRSAFEAIPPRAMQTMAEEGIKFRIGKRLTELNPELKGVHPRGWPAGMTWDSAEGMFSPSQKAVNVTEFYRPISKKEFVRNPRTRGVVLHESGHAFDAALGKVSTTSSAFIYAYTVDRKSIPKEARRGLRYYLQKGSAGRSEAFAETFAWVTGEVGAGRTDIRPFFPRVAKLVKDAADRGLWLEPVA